jgi:hypothetical protein
LITLPHLFPETLEIDPVFLNAQTHFSLRQAEAAGGLGHIALRGESYCGM